MTNSPEDPKAELRNLHEKIKKDTSDSFREIMGVDISDEDIEKIVKKIDGLTQDDASTYELNDLLIQYDENKESDDKRVSIGNQLRAKILSILSRG